MERKRETEADKNKNKEKSKKRQIKTTNEPHKHTEKNSYQTHKQHKNRQTHRAGSIPDRALRPSLVNERYKYQQ